MFWCHLHACVCICGVFAISMTYVHRFSPVPVHLSRDVKASRPVWP